MLGMKLQSVRSACINFLLTIIVYYNPAYLQTNTDLVTKFLLFLSIFKASQKSATETECDQQGLPCNRLQRKSKITLKSHNVLIATQFKQLKQQVQT